MILYGARGQAKVIYDLILSNNHLLEYLVDDDPYDDFPHHLNIYKPTKELIENKKVIIAIGDNQIRERIYHQIIFSEIPKIWDYYRICCHENRS